MNWNQAQHHSLKLRQKRMFLEAQKAAVEEQRKRNVALSIQAQERIQSDELVKEVLERIQHREHERAVGAYEQLLGAFLSDVLPGERQIVMDLHTDRSAPALDIFIKKGENMPLEDAWLGTGGSVTNLLSTGLRLVALLRSDQRRFLVLDESDCWIKPTLIPQYAAVVSQMSHELGVQVLMISHHDESLFAQHIPNRLRLTRNNSGLLAAEWSPTSDIPQWNAEEIGLRCIGLKDFQSHQNTLIPLASGVTLLQGDNDIGKSAVVNALRAVFDADANDTLIKHHASFAQVTLDFGPENLLVWQRFRKGKIKCSYKLLDGDTQEVLHASDGTKTPDWLSDTLKVGKVDGLDIQIGQQQDPVFLLNQPASTRAKALSIGQESGHVNNMMLFDRQELQEAKSSLKACERELEDARRKMMVFTQMSDFNYDELDHQIERAHARKNEYSEAILLMQRWKKSSQSFDILQNTPHSDLHLPEQKSVQARDILIPWITAQNKYSALSDIKEHSDIPVLIPQPKSSAILALLERWTGAYDRHNVLSGFQHPFNLSVPVGRHTESLSLLNTWIKAFDRLEILQQSPKMDIPRPPVVQTKPEHTSLIAMWNDALKQQQQLQHLAQNLEQQESILEHEIKEKFPVCPTCKRSWEV